MTNDQHELRDQIDVAAQRFERGARQGRDRYSGSSSNDAVTVELNREGRMVLVRVSPSWQDTLAPSELGGAILDALSAAQGSRLEEWGQEAEEAADEDLRARSLPVFEEDLATRLADRLPQASSPEEVEATLQTMATMLREVRESVRTARRDLTDVLESTVRGVSDTTRKVEVTVQGTGEIADIRLDPAWLERAHPANINRLVLVAVEDAYARIAGRTVTDVVERSRLAELARLLNDPEYIDRQLRL